MLWRFSNLQDSIEADVPEYRYKEEDAFREDDAPPKKFVRYIDRRTPLSSTRLQSTHVQDLRSTFAPPTVILAPENVELETWSGAPDRFRLNSSA
jgi:hypothetical protein